MNKLDELLNEALETQRKIAEIINSIKESEDSLTEEEEDKIDEIKHKMKTELLPEIERLERNNKGNKAI